METRAPSADAKTVRVFISSTFRDMHAERDVLVTVVFPALRERLDRLGLDFFDVDLRWGVPETGVDGERANSWAYCRQWIDRVEPFFVCMLGQRYGWRPPAAEIASDADRTAYEGLSITEMEVRHAELRGDARHRSFFYFRDTDLPPAPATPSDVYDRFVDVSDEARLDALKQAIAATGHPVRRYPCRWVGDGFADLDAFGDMVLEDLWSGVLRDERFVPKAAWRAALGHDPDGDPLYRDQANHIPEDVWTRIVEAAKPEPADPLDAEAQQMAAFAAARLRWFKGRTRELEQLKAFVDGPLSADAGRLCVVQAAAGAGKSALLAKLADELASSSHIVIYHFVGASERSADARSLVERLVKELDRNNVPHPAEEDTLDLNSLTRRLAARLEAYSATRRIVLVVDGVNQLTDGHDLSWLPHRFGPSVRVVLSCIDTVGTSQTGAEAKVAAAVSGRLPAPRVVSLRPLTSSDVREIVSDYLLEYCKELDREQLDAIAEMLAARNPLYLMVMLHELRTLGGDGMHLQVRTVIAELPTKRPDTISLFDWVLERLEAFGREAVERWWIYLSLGRVGMSGRELRDLLYRSLGDAGARTALKVERSVRHYLQRRGGQWDFFHGQLRQAVARRYGHHEVVRFHVDIADYFEIRWREADTHALGELPFHEGSSGMWTQLERTLCDLTFVEAKCSAGMIDGLLGDFSTTKDLVSRESAARLSYFAGFVGRNMRHLRRTPTLTIQLALLEGSSPVGAAGRRLAQSADRPLLAPKLLSPLPGGSSPFLSMSHERGISDLSFERDGQHLISWDSRDLVRWDTKSAALVSSTRMSQGWGSRYHFGAFSTYGDAFSCHGVVVDVRSGAELLRLHPGDASSVSGPPIVGERLMQPSVTLTGGPAISSDLRLFAFATKMEHPQLPSRDHKVIICSRGKPVVDDRFEIPCKGDVRFLQFSHDSRMLVIQEDSWFGKGGVIGKPTVRVWDIRARVEVHRADIQCKSAVFSADDSTLVLGGWDIIGLSTADWTKRYSIEDPTEDTVGVHSIDESLILAWGPHSITLWATPTGKAVGRIVVADGSNISTCAVSRDRGVLAIGREGGTIELWDVDAIRGAPPPEVLTRTADEVRRGGSVAFSHGGSLAAVCHYPNQVRLLERDSGAELASRVMLQGYRSDQADACRFSVDDESLVLVLTSSRPGTIVGYRPHDWYHFGSVKCVSTRDLLDQATADFERQRFDTPKFSDDGETIVTVAGDKLVALRSNDLSRVCEHTLRADASQGWDVSPDGSACVLASRDEIGILQFADNSVRRRPEWFRQPVFSPDGSLIATRGHGRGATIRLVSSADFRDVGALSGDLTEGSPTQWTFAPDGRSLLVVCERSVWLCDLRDAKSMKLEGAALAGMDSRELDRYRFTPGGEFVVGRNSTDVRLWSRETGRLLTVVPLGSIEATAMTTDGTLLGVLTYGAFRTFEFVNVPLLLPIGTATRRYSFDARSAGSEWTTTCGHCGLSPNVPKRVLDRISRVLAASGLGRDDSPILRLPSDAWADEELVGECSSCGKSLRFNPFACPVGMLVNRLHET